MARWFISFGVLVALGGLSWPWLHEFGLAKLPGDMAVDFVPGVNIHLPITTALVTSAVISAIWSLIDR